MVLTTQEKFYAAQKIAMLFDSPTTTILTTATKETATPKLLKKNLGSEILIQHSLGPEIQVQHKDDKLKSLTTDFKEMHLSKENKKKVKSTEQTFALN